MRKTKKKLAVLGMSMMIVLGLGVVTYASTTEHTITVKTSYASSSFTYGNGGNELINILYYTEMHTDTYQRYQDKVISVANGSSTSATAIKSADTGYVMTEAYATAKVNGVQVSRTLTTRP